MQHGTDSVPGKIAAAVAGAFLFAGLQMFHSILDSLLIFGALLEGGTAFGYLDWLGSKPVRTPTTPTHEAKPAHRG